MGRPTATKSQVRTVEQSFCGSGDLRSDPRCEARPAGADIPAEASPLAEDRGQSTNRTLCNGQLPITHAPLPPDVRQSQKLGGAAGFFVVGGHGLRGAKALLRQDDDPSSICNHYKSYCISQPTTDSRVIAGGRIGGRVVTTAPPSFDATLELGFRGSTAVVLGVGPGIGAATVQALAAAGCVVVAADLDGSVAERTAATIGGSVRASQVDVTDRASVRALFAEIAGSDGRLSTVIDVVGMARPKAFDETSDEDWRFMLELNLRQQFVVAQEAARVLTSPGSLVAVASINGVVSSPRNSAYGAAKAGLVSLVRSQALELAERGIRVNAVAPGIVETPRLRTFFESTRRRDEFASAVPMKRVADPADIAGAILFLASPLASYVTGQVICVDGGVSVKYPLPLTG